jgi:ribosomal protein S18 acetylase RimI-like enzyme
MTATATRTRRTSGTILHVGAPGPAVILESAALLNASLGEGYVDPAELADITAGGRGILVRARDKRRQLIGAATTRILTPVQSAALQEKLPAAARSLLAGQRIGELKSSAVDDAALGRGVGTEMLRACLAFLKAGGCRYAVAASWVSADTGHASLGLLERAGFTVLATIPGFWAGDQSAAGYACPDCGGQCRCTAAIMVLELDAA